MLAAGETRVLKNPLIELSNERQVRQAAEFRQAAVDLSGAELASRYTSSVTDAPRRQEAGRQYFEAHPGRIPRRRRKGRDAEDVAAALAHFCRTRGAQIPLPDEGQLELFDHHVPLGAADGDQEIGPIDALGVAETGRLAVVELRYIAPDATRVGVGDTPLRALLGGLGRTAIAAANLAALKVEMAERFGRQLSEDPPKLVLLASPRYWELCRKREAQKGAAWIKELERLASEIEAETGVSVRYCGLELNGSPGWGYDKEGPALEDEPKISAAWEPGAGRVRPKPRPRLSSTPAQTIVEADLTRPVRGYTLTESYQSGDRIDHPTLGAGVVQGVAGPGKIEVRFDGRRSLLVHERAKPSA
jgi:hypothetical protein